MLPSAKGRKDDSRASAKGRAADRAPGCVYTYICSKDPNAYTYTCTHIHVHTRTYSLAKKDRTTRSLAFSSHAKTFFFQGFFFAGLIGFASALFVRIVNCL